MSRSTEFVGFAATVELGVGGVDVTFVMPVAGAPQMQVGWLIEAARVRWVVCGYARSRGRCRGGRS